MDGMVVHSTFCLSLDLRSPGISRKIHSPEIFRVTWKILGLSISFLKTITKASWEQSSLGSLWEGYGVTSLWSPQCNSLCPQGNSKYTHGPHLI